MPSGGVAWGRVCASSLRSRLVFKHIHVDLPVCIKKQGSNIYIVSNTKVVILDRACAAGPVLQTPLLFIHSVIHSVCESFPPNLYKIILTKPKELKS